jgi:hypothetical protein
VAAQMMRRAGKSIGMALDPGACSSRTMENVLRGVLWLLLDARAANETDSRTQLPVLGTGCSRRD